MEKYKKYLDQDEKLNEKYSEYRKKMIKNGKKDEDILTRDQYIAQARGIEIKIRKSLFRIPIPIIIYFLFLNYQTETQNQTE